MSQPASTAAAMEPKRRTSLMTRRWLAWPCSDSMPLAQRHAERRAQDVGLDVVGGEAVAGEEQLDPALAHQPGQGRRGAGVDDGRPAHGQDPPAAGAPLATVTGVADAGGHAGRGSPLWAFPRRPRTS